MTHLSLASTHISVYYPFFPYFTSLYSTALCNIHDSNTDCCSIIDEGGATIFTICSEDLITFISGVRTPSSLYKLCQKKRISIWAVCDNMRERIKSGIKSIASAVLLTNKIQNFLEWADILILMNEMKIIQNK